MGLYNITVPGKKSKTRHSNMIGVEHTEFKKNSYRSVYVCLFDGTRKEFATGDPVKDFSDALTFAMATEYDTIYSSTVDDFVMDDGGYKYDDNDMIVKRHK